MSGDLSATYWARQGFERSGDDLPSVVGAAGGLYGMAPTCYLSLVARLGGFERAGLDHALYETRELVRVRAMRASLYMIPRPMLPVVVAATRELAVRGFVATLRGVLGPAAVDRWAGRVEEVLDGGDLSAADIRRALAPTGAVADNLKYLIALMAAEGRIVRARVQGSWRSNRFTYARWEEWLAEPLPPLDGEAARVRLARWYLEAHAPATVDDFRWWSGLTVAAARAAMASAEPDEVDTARGPMLAIGGRRSVEPPAGVRLLPVWDTALIGHVDRARIVPEDRRDHVYDRLGNATSVVIVDGVAAGLWQLDGLDTLAAKVAPFDEFDDSTWSAIGDEADRIAAALGARDIAVERCRLPQPLLTAPRNRFLSPLADSC